VTIVLRYASVFLVERTKTIEEMVISLILMDKAAAKT